MKRELKDVEKRIAELKSNGWEVKENKVCGFDAYKTVEVTSRDPFGNATGRGEKVLQKQIDVYSDGTAEEIDV